MDHVIRNFPGSIVPQTFQLINSRAQLYCICNVSIESRDSLFGNAQTKHWLMFKSHMVHLCILDKWFRVHRKPIKLKTCNSKNTLGMATLEKFGMAGYIWIWNQNYIWTSKFVDLKIKIFILRGKKIEKKLCGGSFDHLWSEIGSKEDEENHAWNKTRIFICVNGIRICLPRYNGILCGVLTAKPENLTQKWK